MALDKQEDITRLEQQLFDARTEIARLHDDLYNSHQYIEKLARERRTGKIRIYVKGLLNELTFMYKMGDLYADIIYQDNKYLKLDSLDKQERYTYNSFSQRRGDII